MVTAVPPVEGPLIGVKLTIVGGGREGGVSPELPVSLPEDELSVLVD